MSDINPGIHRYLDEAFAGVTMTPETQDLKEEIRGNLAARVRELQAGGMPAPEAASTAVKELGDIHEIIDSVGTEAPKDRLDARAAAAAALNRVRPKPLFVVRTVVLALLLAAGLIVLGLVVSQRVGLITGTGLVVAAVVTLAGGIIVGDSLRQETTQHFAMPTRRAVLFGIAAAFGFAAISLAALYIGDSDRLAFLIGAIVAALVSLVGFVWLGVTQTNRTKPWALAMNREYELADGFSNDPAAAARFGIYTVVIWVIAFAALVVLTIVVGFAWSWLALLAGVAVFMFVLARMLFPANAKKEG